MTNCKETFELLVAAESISNNSSVQNRDNQGELYLFEFILKEHGFLTIESQRYDCPADSYFMIPPNVENSYWSAPGIIQEKIFFVCRGSLVKSLVATYELEKSYMVANARSLVKYFYNMLIVAKQYGARKDREAALIFHKFIQAAHLIVYKDDEPLLPPMVQELHRLLDAHLEKKIDFSIINKEIACSQAYMVRLFKKHMGVTPHEYILRRRLETAQLLLKHSTLSIKEIAERLVFSDQYHFSNYFKKRLGISPSQFRKPEVS
ncbi:MAG: AraC family transcriptional regulator [Victivallaceae bacterium]|nr:AraC family transcriptional regulator [Victivallaceae bacterium]